MLPSLPALGAQFQITQRDVGLLSGQITPIANQNGNRYAIIFSNQTAQAAVVKFGTGVTTNTGMRVINTTNPTILSFEEVGGIVQLAMFADCDVPSTTLNVTEIIWLPQTSPNDEVNR